MCPSRDNHYKIEPRGLKADDVLRDLKNTKLKYYFGKINSTTDKMIKEFKKIAGPNIIQVADMRNFNLLGIYVILFLFLVVFFPQYRTLHLQSLISFFLWLLLFQQCPARVKYMNRGRAGGKGSQCQKI